MMESPHVEKKILKILRESNKNRRRGCSLEELHQKTGLCRTTISKHIGILEAKEKVIIENYGNMKLVYLNDSPSATKGREP
jgi:predicted transcriptional regulator